MKNVKQPVALVTGSGSGIGRATAWHFSNQGYKVILVGRNLLKLEKTATKLTGEYEIFTCDLSVSAEVEKLACLVSKKYSQLDVLVNNAGIYERQAFVGADGGFKPKADPCDSLTADSNSYCNSAMAHWHRIFNINVFGLVDLTRRLLPLLSRSDTASIVNVASTAGLRPVSGLTAYATSKAAVIGFTQSLALELASVPVRVNCVCPGIVDTPILNADSLDEETKEKLKKQWGAMHPLGRMGEPSEVAQVIFNLSSSESSWLTGVVLPVDGGISLT
jgi:NAD(P)-dependent dehydrogenase (short-subunit alcohol dehydrogenase family)